MILSDVNVLLYALRDDSADHTLYRDWLLETVNSDAAYGMSPQVLSSVIRVATNPRVYVRPSRPVDAVKFADTLLQQPNCQIIQPGPRHWSIFTGLCSSARTQGNLVQDAWFAALAIECGAEWITTDRDYSRFEGLRWRPPF